MTRVRHILLRMSPYNEVVEFESSYSIMQASTGQGEGQEIIDTGDD